MSTKKWKLKDGTKVRIKDMTDSHLKNSIAMLDRMYENAILNASAPICSGDMAQYYAEMEFDNLMESAVDDVFPKGERKMKLFLISQY